MRILFETDHAYLPQRVGGSEASTHAFARGLKERGHETTVLAKLYPKGALGTYHRLARKLTRRPVADRRLGYPVYRAWDFLRARRDVIARLDPDIVVIEGSFPMQRVSTLLEEDRHVVVFLRHCQWHRLGGVPTNWDGIAYAANSYATAREYADRFRIRAQVIPPIIDPQAYRCRPRPRHVTFINPVPEKGVELALEIAQRCPEIPFAFVRSWPRPESEWTRLRARLAPLSNAKLIGPFGDMRKIYRSSAFLLVPSQWFEAWGRVVKEGQVSGIPALASDSGGLPDAVGRGGIIVPRGAAPEIWAERCRQLWSDEAARKSLARKARSEAENPAHQPETLVKKFEDLLASL